MKKSHLSRLLAIVMVIAMIFALGVPALACSSIELTSKEGDVFWFRTCDMNDSFNLFGENGSMIASSYLASYPAGQPIEFTTGAVTPKHTVVGVSFGDSLAMLDGINDAGLICGLQNFNEGTSWPEDKAPEGGYLVSAMESVTWFLAQCSSVSDVEKLAAQTKVKAIHVKGIPYSELTATMHLTFTDPTGRCIVLENADTKNPGTFTVYESVGVMTNSPTYPEHIQNLKDQIGKDADVKEAKATSITLNGITLEGTPSKETAPISEGNDSVSRFVRLAMYRWKAHEGKEFSSKEMLARGVDTLAKVHVPYTSGQKSFTQYTVAYDVTNRSVYVRPYDSLTWTNLSLKDVSKTARATYDIVRTSNQYALKADATPNVAYASTQKILVDGKTVAFPTYALKDANGNETNYVNLRDVASVLNGTKSQFEVGYTNGTITMKTGTAYTATGSELKSHFNGNQTYQGSYAAVTVNGRNADPSAIVLTDANGGDYTYFKLRDLGTALGFTVDYVNNQITVTSAK